MKKKGMTIGETLLAFILLVIVILAVMPYGSKIWNLIKIGVGFGTLEKENGPQDVPPEIKNTCLTPKPAIKEKIKSDTLIIKI